MNVTISVSARALRLGVVLAVAAAVLVVPAIVWASHAFTDVASGNVHHDAVDAIAAAGVTQGCAVGRYCPTDAVRRDQMASFMDRLGALSGQQPVVNAATAQQADSAGQAADSAALGGTDAQELLDRIQALEDNQAAGDLADRVDALETDLAAATGRIDILETDLAAATGRVDALEADLADLQAILADVTRTTVDGRDTLTFAGMNLHVVNGTGTTGGVPNGLGNLIIGYNAPRPDTDPVVDRAGSHYLITGDRHHWTAYGGLLAGISNTATGAAASVTGGTSNTASGARATVTGGVFNTASGDTTSVTGGRSNTASGPLASVTGGDDNTASGFLASVTGGTLNTASGDAASVTGGDDNTASGFLASVNGGDDNTASGFLASVTGGADNLASGGFGVVSGGQSNVAGGEEAWVGGGKANTAGGEESSVSGGRNNAAAGVRASILGGAEHTIASDTFNECHPSCP